MTFQDLDLIKLHKAGMDANRVSKHQRRISAALKGELQTYIPVLEACTLQNGGVLPWEHLSSSLEQDEGLTWRKQHLMSFIPAAGAASRFLKDLYLFHFHVEGLIDKVTNLDEHLTKIELDSRFVTLWNCVQQQKFERVKALASKLRTQIKVGTPHANIVVDAYCAAKALIECHGQEPKALVETTLEGDTFLDIKILEQRLLSPCYLNVLVVPAGMVNGMEVQLEASRQKLNTQTETPENSDRWRVVEQGNSLSTIRFNYNSEPFVENDEYSPVSAGHGELVHVLEDLTQQTPEAQCVHIRNIDNIIGVEKKVTAALSVLAEVFRKTKNALDTIRTTFEQEQRVLLSREVVSALEFLSSLSPTTPSFDHNETGIEKLFAPIFGWPVPATAPSFAHLMEKISQPLSVFGVVKKEATDVGGGPVIAQMKDGSAVKLCMEMPHASSEDSKKYFEAGGACTHFNPVLVYFEMRTFNGKNGKNLHGRAVNFGQLFDERFWLLSKREYQGQRVCYHETVLYELLGNSARTNLLFVEVPRTLFTPHKSIFDSLGHSRESYGIKQAFKDSTAS